MFFCNASGQRISYNKSLLFVSGNIQQEEANDLSSVLGISLTAELGKYLGHPLIHRGRSSCKEDALVQRVRSKLEGWKSCCLSRVGRLTLARSLLCNMGVFYMQL